MKTVRYQIEDLVRKNVNQEILNHRVLRPNTSKALWRRLWTQLGSCIYEKYIR